MFRAIAFIWRNWENTVPNFVTLGRLLLFLWGVHVFSWLYWNPWLMLLCCATSGVLDGVDGFLAKVLNQRTPSGKMLDPLTDKICGWNGAFVLIVIFLTDADWPVLLIFAPSAIPFVLIGIYDLMTMTMRTSDDGMVTNETARVKQGVLFSSLGILLIAVIFKYMMDAEDDPSMRNILYITHVLFVIVGELVLWQALRMAAESARIYFAQTKDLRAKSWQNVSWISWVLRTI